MERLAGNLQGKVAGRGLLLKMLQIRNDQSKATCL